MQRSDPRRIPTRHTVVKGGPGHWSLDHETRECLYTGMGGIIEKAGGSILKAVLFHARVKR